MDKEKKEQGKKCFIITPIGNDGSETFRKAKGVIESVIKPILQRNGFNDIKPAYDIVDSGMIGNQIINRIVNDDLVVANLTGNNPNVMYELAIRHACAKPIIHICEKGTVLPFDIKDNRTIFYTDDMLGVQELQSNFQVFVENIKYSEQYIDNPIYSAIRTGNIFKKMNDEGQQDIAEILQDILDKVSNISGTNNVIFSDRILSDNSKQKKNVQINLTIECNDPEMVAMFENWLANIIELKKILYITTNTKDRKRYDLYFNFIINTSEIIIEHIYKYAAELNITIIECKIMP